MRELLRYWTYVRRTRAHIRLRLTYPLSRTPPCPVCASPASARHVATNVLRDELAVRVYECPSCTHKFVDPIPSAAQLLSWYQPAKYHENNREMQGIHSLDIDAWRGFIHDRMQALREDVLNRFDMSGCLFIGEFGCAEGAFLKHLSLQGHRVIGFEASKSAATLGLRTYGIEIVSGDFEALTAPREALDVIVSFHTLEHLRRPMQAISQAAAMLRSGGGILIEVPCDDREMDSADHLQFFTGRSLIRLLEGHFTDLKVRPNSYLREGVTHTASIYVSGRKPQ